MRTALLLVACSFCWLAGGAEPPSVPAHLVVQQDPNRSSFFDWYAGLGIHYLHPDPLPAFQAPTNSFGLFLDRRIWRGVFLSLGAHAAGLGQIDLWLGEVGLRWLIPTPFLDYQLGAGGAYFQYDSPDRISQWGSYAGLGVYIPIGQGYSASLWLRSLFFQKTLVDFALAFQVGF